jgi:putative flippase GtrA
MSPGVIRLLKYALVGGATFLFDLVLLYLLTDVFHIQYLLSAGIAFVIAVSINYAISRKLVFSETKRAVGVGYGAYIVIALIGLVAVVAGMALLVEVLQVQYLFARVSIALFVGIWNYSTNLFLNFKVAGIHKERKSAE